MLAAVVLAAAYDWRFAAVAVVDRRRSTPSSPSPSPTGASQHRRELNEADTEAAGRAVDALLNYETVKAFGAEPRAAAAYDEALQRYAPRLGQGQHLAGPAQHGPGRGA